MKIRIAEIEDLEKWIDLVKREQEYFPGLEIKEYESIVKKFIQNKEAICVEKDKKIIGSLLFSKKEKELCFLVVDKNYRKQHLGKKMIEMMLENFESNDRIKVSTYREEDEKGKNTRLFYKKLGFIEGELSIEFNYPVQVFYLLNKNKE